MVKIVGYDAPAQPSRSDYGSQKYSENGSYSRQPSRSEYNEYAGSLNQGNISGTLHLIIYQLLSFFMTCLVCLEERLRKCDPYLNLWCVVA